MSAKTQRLTIYLIKADVKAFADALSADANATELALKKDLGFDGVLFTKVVQAHVPHWAKFVQGVTDSDLAKTLRSQHSSAILFLRAAGRIFAIVFGYARTLLDPSTYERDFGLKVVLNSVDPEKIRCVDKHSIDEIPVLTRQQASRLSALEMFDLDRDSEMLRAIVGTPRSGLLGGIVSLGNTIAGAEALSISPKIEPTSMGRLCTHLLKLYRRRDYAKNGFDWVDNLRRVTDPTLCDQLNADLLAKLKSSDAGHISLAPPQMLEWDDVEGLRYSTDPNTRRELLRDMNIEDFYSTCKDLGAMTIENVMSARVTVRSKRTGVDAHRFTLYDCLVYDTVLSGNRYVLANGMWFCLDRDFAAEVVRGVGALPEALLTLPAANHDEREEDYSRRAAQNQTIAHMDQRFVHPTNMRAKIEVCDLFTGRRQFVHIKPYKASSTLSHLYSQGTISADLFQNDAGFRKAARDKVEETRKSIAGKIPKRGDPNTRDFEVVYAVISDKRWSKPWQNHLPFFAQLNLRQAATMLRNRGYRVAVKLIPRA